MIANSDTLDFDKFILAQVYINGKWIKCDPSTDIYLSDRTSHINQQSKLVDWDPELGAMLNLEKSHVLEEKYLLPNIDELIAKKPKTGKGLVVELGNLYINFLRHEGSNIKKYDEIRPLFMKWLKSNSRRHHYIYVINSFLSKISV